jgi:hypothetical protein
VAHQLSGKLEVGFQKISIVVIPRWIVVMLLGRNTVLCYGLQKTGIVSTDIDQASDSIR